jgi:hypothetical protein
MYITAVSRGKMKKENGKATGRMTRSHRHGDRPKLSPTDWRQVLALFASAPRQDQPPAGPPELTVGVGECP